MGPVERFTRDAASRYVWIVVALAAAAGLAYAYSGGDRAVSDARVASEERAIRYVDEVLEPRLGSRDSAAPITGQSADSLEAVVRRSILTDERVARVRLWSIDGTLLFSTDRWDTVGSNEGLNDPVLIQASREGALTRWNFSDGGGPNDPERSMLRTYAPLGAAAVAEIDQTDEGTVALARTEWGRYQLLAGGLLLLSLILLAFSLRDPIERLNVGVPFAVSSVPRGFSLIDDDRLAAVQEVYRLASERVARLQEKLEESEQARKRLEGDIQRTLSKAATDAQRPVAPAASATPAVPAPREPDTSVVQVPESDVVVTSPLGGMRAAAPAGPLARATRAQKPAPTTSLKQKPAAEKRKRSPKKLMAKPAKPAASTTEAVTPRPAAEPVAVVPTAPARAKATTRAAARAPARAKATTRAAARAPAPAPADAEMDDAKAHAAALETFIRLTESDRQHHETDPADQGEMRAALARTAARKKPGGERLQPHDMPEESLGGPPKPRD